MTPKAKNRIIGIVCFFAGMIATIIGFVILTTYVSFFNNKEKDDMTEEEIQAAVDAEALEQAMEDYTHYPFELPLLAGHRHAYLCPDDIPVGSWWTDGDVYFKVLSNEADTLYMVGTNLEDRGMEITFVKRADSTMVTDGASVYAFHDSPVIYNRIILADGSEAQMLVAYYDKEMFYPQAILQRYHGKGLENQHVLPQNN